MSRVQLALNVSDLQASIEFYTTLFGTPPHKRRDGYANFQIAEPPLKLVLIEVGEQVRGTGPAGALNHLGVEVSTSGEVREAIDRLDERGLTTRQEMATICCHAEQDKVWVDDPAGTPWEVYTITDDAPAELTVLEGDGACCTPGLQQSACC